MMMQGWGGWQSDGKKKKAETEAKLTEGARVREEKSS